MKHSMKRLLSLLLALIFCVSLFPAAALAVEPGEIARRKPLTGGPPRAAAPTAETRVRSRPRRIPARSRPRMGRSCQRAWWPPAPAAII